MPRRTLTDRFCAHAKAREGEARTDYFDESRKGLALRVTRTGTRSWTYHFTLGGRRVRMTFGTYPASSLAKAHTLADEANAARARFISSNLASASFLQYVSRPSIGWPPRRKRDGGCGWHFMLGDGVLRQTSAQLG